MKVSLLNSKVFESACRSYAGCALWCSHGEDEEFLDAEKGIEDFSEEALSFIAGEVLAIFRVLPDVESLYHETVDSVCHSLAGQAVGSGMSVRDNPLFGLEKEQLQALSDWHDKRWGTRTLDLYVGDDGKVYIAGYENFKEISVKMSLAEGKGRNGAMFDFKGKSVSVDALAVMFALVAHENDWTKSWIKSYEGITE